jgi:drug/metabolite transporter (DMT)-like permease
MGHPIDGSAAIAESRAGAMTRHIGPGGSFLGFACAVLALLIWSGWFAVTRISVTRTLGPADIVAFRLVGGALVLLPLFLPQIRAISRRHWAEGAVLSLLWGAPFALLVALGVQLTSAAHAAALTPSTMPVFAGMIAWAAFGEFPGRQRLLGFAVIAGGAVVLNRSFGEHGGATAWGGDAALLGAALMWGIYTIRLRRSGMKTVQTAAMVCLYSLVIYVPCYALSGVQRLTAAPLPEILLQFAYQGLLVGGVAVLAYNFAVGQLGGRAAVVIALVPVVAALLAIPINGEVPSMAEWIGIGAIAAGALLAAWGALPAGRAGDGSPGRARR